MTRRKRATCDHTDSEPYLPTTLLHGVVTNQRLFLDSPHNFPNLVQGDSMFPFRSCRHQQRNLSIRFHRLLSPQQHGLPTHHTALFMQPPSSSPCHDLVYRPSSLLQQLWVLLHCWSFSSAFLSLALPSDWCTFLTSILCVAVPFRLSGSAG